VDLNDAMRANVDPGTADSGWTWPPYAPVEPVHGEQFATDEWAPASTVRRPWVRLGRWTLLYRRSS
jgi:hypothetical protein